MSISPNETAQSITLPQATVVNDDLEEIEHLRDEVRRITNENNTLGLPAASVGRIVVVADEVHIERKKKKIFLVLLVIIVVAAVVAVVLVVTLPSKSNSMPEAVETSTPAPTMVPTRYPPTSSLPGGPSLIPTFTLPTWSQLGEDLLGQDQNEQFANVALNADGGDVLAISGIGAYDLRGVVRVYKYSAPSNWTQLGSDVIGPPFSSILSAKFGGRLAISKDGMVLAAAAPFANDFLGTVYIYQYSSEDEDWIPYGNTSDGVVGVLTVPGARMFGIGLSLSRDGTKMAINSNTFARVYSLANGTWEKVGQEIRDRNVNMVYTRQDGRALAVRSETMSTTRVYFLNENDEEWVQVGNDIVMESSGSGFIDLSADAKTIAISNADYGNGLSDVADNAGNVIVLRFDALTGNWTRLGPAVGAAKLLKGTFAREYFGTCISLSPDGNRILVGSPSFNNNSGFLRLLDWTGEKWVRGSVDVEGNLGEQLGFYCSLAGSRMASGGPTFGNLTGFARVFELEE